MGSAGETRQTSEYTVRVETRSGDVDRVEIEAVTGNQALSQATQYSAWEIGVNGKYEQGFEHFTVFAETLEDAEEKLLNEESKASSIIDNSQFCLGDVTAVELRGERGV